MSIASLLLKEDASTSLSTLVEKALQKKPPFPEYELQLNVSQLVLIQRTNIEKFPKNSQTDEGFESDIDTLSIVSSDDSFTSGNTVENGSSKTPETDSANGSASSDSDTDSPTTTKDGHKTNENSLKNEINNELIKENYNLVNCICYTDVKCTEILVFVIENKALVFKFNNITNLESFHTRFATLKAVNNQVIYNRNTKTTPTSTSTSSRKFNLLQKTDNNGVTHIQITREPTNVIYVDDGPSSIISINTPEDNLNQLIKTSVQHIKSLNEYNNTNTINKRQQQQQQTNKDNNEKLIDKSASTNDLLDIDGEATIVRKKNFNLRKIWNSTENILDTLPKRPERKKRIKGQAPSPPEIEIKQDILSGQYVKVNVQTDLHETSKYLNRGQIKEAHPKKLQNFGISTKPSLNFFVKNKAAQILRYAPSSNPKKLETSTLTRHKTPPQETWTNSIPRIFKQPRSKSETRVVQPMAYRYVDTTSNYPLTYVPLQTSNGRLIKSHEVPFSFGSNSQNYKTTNKNGSTSTIGNRLFGLSAKLKDFNPHDTIDGTKWKHGNRQNGEGNLKSVIKKDDNKRKNDKKVTFSAYTTVQVV